MKDLRIEAMDAPLVRHFHDQAEHCLNRMELSRLPPARWYWRRKLKHANAMWREVLEQEVRQLKAELGHYSPTGDIIGKTRRVALDNGEFGLGAD